jgi:CheY-like chemotaxis protein
VADSRSEPCSETARDDAATSGDTTRALRDVASGAAHHLNNLLMVVIGRAELMLATVQVPALRDSLAIIDQAARDASDVVRRLHEWSRSEPGDASRSVDLHALVGLHGGDVERQSGAGDGAPVTVDRPQRPTRAESSVTPTRADRASAPPAVDAPARGAPVSGALRVLLADDEPGVRDVLGSMIENLGHRVILANGGREALAHLERGASPDVVLTDLGMPEVNGRDVALAVKHRWPSIRVGLVTGWLDAEEPRRPGDPVDFVVSKPVTLAKLEALLSVIRPA